MRAGVVVVAAGLLVGPACTGAHDAAPSPRPAPTTSTTAVDRSGIALAGVPGETTTTEPTTGHAHLVGTVTGPAGPVPGATVRIERLGVAGTTRTDVATGADGRFELDGVPGGRYRVRAFLSPALAQLTAVVAFVAEGADHAFDLRVEDQEGLVVRSDVAPDAPVLGGAVNLVALVARRSVDPDGIVRAHAVTGASVELAGLGRWVLDDPAAPATVRLDGAGRAEWALRCRAAGDPGLSLRLAVAVAPPPGAPAGAAPPTSAPTPSVRIETVSLEVPACAAPSASSTSTSAP